MAGDRVVDPRETRAIKRAFARGAADRMRAERREIVPGYRWADDMLLRRIEQKLDVLLGHLPQRTEGDAWNDKTRA